MNKTITMNLSGIIFHIEENAYEKLNNYLTTIKGYFNNSESRDEIMNDIEARIAEMLQEKVSHNKQAILLADVEAVIQIMGKPEDYFDGSENTEKNTSTSSSKEHMHEEQHTKKRLFRDPDDKVLGGVCSGIGNYFNFDPIWLRAAFAISFFVFGSGLLLYIILLIIIPKAKTTAEKLEMRGEKIDINNIGKTVNEEFEDFKKRMKEFGDDMASPKNKHRMKQSATQAGNFITDVFHNIVRVIGKIFAVLIIIIGVLFMIVLLSSIFGADVIHINTDDFTSSYSFYEFINAFFPDNLPIELAVLGILLFLGIPIISLIYSGIRYLFGIKYKNKIVGYTSSILWLCGLGILIYIGVEVSSNFSKTATNKQMIKITPTKSEVLYLTMNKSKYGIDSDIYNDYDSHINIDNWMILKKDEKIIQLGYPKLDIQQSETDSIELIVIKTAKGANKKEAAYHAKNIEYLFYQTDSLISFEPYFSINNYNKWRVQNVKLILKLPVNKIVYLDKSIKDLIEGVDNVSDTYDPDMVKCKWMMKKEGLTCIGCDDALEENKNIQ